MKRKNFTMIDNNIFLESQLTYQARFLYCILLKYAGKKDYCYPSQSTLAQNMGLSDRHIRNLIDELIKAGILSKKRTGFNKPNTYFVTKELERERNGSSYQVGSKVPGNEGMELPSKNTYIKRKDKNDANGIESVDDFLRRKGLRLSKVERLN